MQQIEMHKYYEKTICFWPTTLTISKFSSSNSTWCFILLYTITCNQKQIGTCCKFQDFFNVLCVQLSEEVFERY